MLLTNEQLLAAASDSRLAFIEASPGSGKTTVAAERFGYHRFVGDISSRGVVAVSFTRAATQVLRNRIVQRWGSSALANPNRVTTIDGLLAGIVSRLLKSGAVRWPRGVTELTVDDDWRFRARTKWTKRCPVLVLVGDQIQARMEQRSKSDNHVHPDDYISLMQQGICTHDEVRRVVQLVLGRADLRDVVAEHLGRSMSYLIVDEVYDANELDLEVIGLCVESGIVTTLVGDPWQALYHFRGATPERVSEILENSGFETFPITESFRFQTEEMKSHAANLRAGLPIALPSSSEGGDGGPPEVVLARWWDDLWDHGTWVAPLAFSRAGSVRAALTHLLLDSFLRSCIGVPGAFVNEARISLGVADIETIRAFDADLQGVLRSLSAGGSERKAVDAAWSGLKAFAGDITNKPLPHGTPRKDLGRLRQRMLDSNRQLVPGMTVHQAKGHEWDRVGVILSDNDVAHLTAGLLQDVEEHRVVYVALTRARRSTLRVTG